MAAQKASLLKGLYRILKALLSLLPRRLCLFLGRVLGTAIYAIDKKHRVLAKSNLGTALGNQLAPGSRGGTARRVFAHFGEFVVDLLKLSTLPAERILRLISLEGRQHLENALSRGRGAILISAHFGNWEIAPAALSKIAPLHVIARPLDDAFFEQQLLTFRTRLGGRVIPKNAAVRVVLRALRANHMVAILIDQNVLRSESVFVDFFGRPTATTPSPALFHLRTGAPLLPVFCSRSPKGRYHIEIGAPVQIPPFEDSQANVLKITELCSKIIEMRIRLNPDQWLWFHDRWKTRPETETENDAIQ